MPAKPVRVHFLDVGEREYGDSVLCDLGGKRVLIDGAHPGDQTGTPGHPSIPQQLSSLLDEQLPVRIDLLVVTHAHQDHIGCLPALVQQPAIEVRWALVADPGLGWGRPADEDAAAPPPDARIATLAAGMREEVLSDATDDRTVAEFLVDAVNLEERYGTMLATLESRGTRVVRHGRDSARGLLRAFRGIGLKILGPSQEQLLVCAREIGRLTDDVAARAADLLQRDATATEPDLYRTLVSGDGPDALDARSRPGPPINLQSVVTAFESGPVKLLFAGDMQFADPQVSDPTVRAEVAKLRGRIQREAPFSLVKLSHHGSDNAVDETVLSELGDTALFGICAGEDSLSHPNRKVLQLLEAQKDRIDWVRTDKNGLVSIEFNGAPKLSPTRGKVDDPQPNAPDAEVVQPARGISTRRAAGPITSSGGIGSGDVEVLTRVPPGVARVTVTIDVERGAAGETGAAPRDRVVELSLAGGRQLPPLLFVTNRDRLAAAVGVSETEDILATIAANDAVTLYDELPVDPANSAASSAFVGEQLRRTPGVQGVVLLGGPMVVPPHRRDSLPPRLRSQLGSTDDPDDFIVWSDAIYGAREGGPMAELPVTRIPDGNSAELVIAALSAPDDGRRPERTGVRNVHREFADLVFAGLPGQDEILRSEPTTFDVTPLLRGDHVYLMLHGDYVDSSRFWGESDNGPVEAVNLTNISQPAARVIFTGCCWGALTADQPAHWALPGSLPAGKAAGSSIALEFLQHGATAFVGCTGAHYSPREEPYQYFGGPMHEAFWARLDGGLPPAEALFQAKIDYVDGIPHGLTTALQQAIEHKTLHQYTCLGLGW
jgi:beta-lactamase superfamily II metal-dependent hydrolase